jgi:hypothetical protein
MVLCGGAPALVRAVDRLRITTTVPHAPTRSEALTKLATRPPRVRRGVTLEPQPDAPGRAQTLLHEACCAWGIPAPNVEKARVMLGELVASSVERVKTCHAVVELDSTRVWVSVSGRCAGIPQLRLRDLWAGRGRGQRNAVLLADQWGSSICGTPRRSGRSSQEMPKVTRRIQQTRLSPLMAEPSGGCAPSGCVAGQRAN